MGFASTYLKERALFPDLIKEAPSENTGIIVVVPSFDEPDILRMLDSLADCNRPSCDVEVLIIINAPAWASEESRNNNLKSILDIESWKKKNPDCFFKLFVIDVASEAISDWGVGLARKTGMDEAARRFNHINRPEGIIINLDADCKVREDYFTAVNCEMINRKDRSACSIYFEHPVSGNEFSDTVYKAITNYELHLRYYYQGLAFSGFPYVHHTVGSAIAVKAQLYVRVGGMNRKKAGEDFYFIQKLVPTGGFFNLTSTTIYPSPRVSFRVPFGTGPAVSRLSEKGDDILFTYNFQAFRELKILFGLLDSIYILNDIENSYSELPPGIKSFIGINDWISNVTEIIRNTSGIQQFRKRFFGWFNMFKIVKYLNTVHISLMEKKPVEQSASELLKGIGIYSIPENNRELLYFYRNLELTAN